MTDLAKYIVALEAQSAQYTAELQKATRKLDDFHRSQQKTISQLKKAFIGFGGSIGAAFSVRALVQFTASAISAADAVGEASRAAGFSTERFQRLQFVFKQGGVDAGGFSSAMNALNTRMGQFITTGAGPAAKALQQLGLSQRVTNGEISTSEQLFDAVRQGLGKISSSSQRAAIASAFFGREIGSKLAPILAQTSAEFKKAEAAATGVFTNETVARADKVADAWERISRSVMSVAQTDAINATYRLGQIAGVDELQPTRGDTLRNNIDTDERQLARLLSGNSTVKGTQAAQAVAMVEERLRLARAELARFELEWGEGPFAPGASNSLVPGTELELLDVNAISARRNEMNRLPDFQEELKKINAKGQDLSPVLEQFISDLQEANNLTESLKDETQQNLEKWQEIRRLFELGLIDEKTMNQLGDLLLQPIEVAAKRIEELKPEVQSWAKELGRGMQSAFADWLVDGEFKFKEFLKRLAAEWLAAKIFKDIDALLNKKGDGKGDSLIGAIFGGARASGGPVAAGTSYLVGENGPEMFTPRSSGTIIPNGGGSAIIQHFNVQAGLPPQWDVQLTSATKIAAQAAYEAVANKMGGRR